jgi:hypothetical protein
MRLSYSEDLKTRNNCDSGTLGTPVMVSAWEMAIRGVIEKRRV